MTKMAACEKIADKELNCCFCADHSEHYGGTAEQAAEKRLRDKSLPQRLKPSIRNAFAALKGRSSTVLQACASLSAVRYSQRVYVYDTGTETKPLSQRLKTLRHPTQSFSGACEQWLVLSPDWLSRTCTR